MRHRSRVRMQGPLAPHQDVIWTDLLSRGYSPLSAKNLLRVAAHLSRWLEANGLSPRDLTRERIGEFPRDRRACGYTWGLTPRSLEPILPLPLIAVQTSDAILAWIRAWLSGTAAASANELARGMRRSIAASLGELTNSNERTNT